MIYERRSIGNSAALMKGHDHDVFALLWHTHQGSNTQPFAEASQTNEFIFAEFLLSASSLPVSLSPLCLG